MSQMSQKKFNPIMTKPCQYCPFRKNGPGFLGKDRAKEIAESIGKLGESFPCHKTIDYTDPDPDTGHGLVTEDSRFCAGACLVLVKEQRPNQIMQVADRLGFYSEPEGSELVFDSLQDFIDYQRS